MNYSIITYIFNNYEPVREIINPQDNVEYVLVTDDKNMKSDTWKVMYEPLLDTDKLSGIAKTFFVKYNAYKYVSNDVYIRLDSQLKILKPLDPIIDDFEKEHNDILVFQHAYNYDFFEEYDDWENWRNADPKFRKMFFEKTKDLGYDYNWKGLFGTTMSICRKTGYVNKFLADMIDYVFSDNYRVCDNNDQCYTTILLMTRYRKRIKTKIVSWTLLDSEYIAMYIHGTQNTSTYCLPYRFNDSYGYFRGEYLGVLEPYNK